MSLQVFYPQMSNISKGFAAVLSIFSFFCLMSKLDSIVHGTLYHYGLRFSFEWANEYWVTYTAIFIAFSLIIGLFYWLGSNRTVDDLKISIALVATVNILMMGGLADIIFFIFWGGGLPPNDITWWWVPWNSLFGVWNSSMQIIFVIAALSITTFLWIRMIEK